MDMTFEQIENRWRRQTGFADPDENGLMQLPLQEQINVCNRAFYEEIAEDPGFPPLIWTVTYLGFPQSVWSVALAVENERKTRERNTEGVVMAFMEHADSNTEYVWQGVLRLMKDLDAAVDLILKGMDRLEEVSRTFLRHCTRSRLASMSFLDAADAEHRADETRLLVRFGLPELRERLKTLDMNRLA